MRHSAENVGYFYCDVAYKHRLPSGLLSHTVASPLLLN